MLDAQVWKDIAFGLWETTYMVFLSTLFAYILGMPLGVLLVVTDEKGYEIGNYKTIIGDEFPGHFGEYEEDSVYVRNENTETDYEILLDSSEDNLE